MLNIEHLLMKQRYFALEEISTIFLAIGFAQYTIYHFKYRKYKNSAIAKVTIYLVGTKKGGNDEQTIELVKLIRDMMAFYIQRHKEDTKALDVFVDRCSKIVGAKKGGDDGKSIDVKKEK